MSSPFLYFAGQRLSEAELCAACLDGHLVGLGEGFIPADAVETAALRAASLSPLVTADLAASHLSAAWILGAIDTPPARHSVQRTSPRRPHMRFSRRYVYRDPQIPLADLWRTGNVTYTSPVRTLVDLLRGDHVGHADARKRLVAEYPESKDGAMQWFDSHRTAIPYAKKAKAYLRNLG